MERFNVPLLETLATVRGGERVSRADLQRLRALELYRGIPGLSETWFAFHPLFREILGDELARTTEADSVAALHWQIAGFATAELSAGRGASLRRGRRRRPRPRSSSRD